MGLYDYAYNKFSLGTYTMLKEAEYGRTGQWFYPGYILDKRSDFDYKLKLGPMEHYTMNKRWAKLENLKPETTTSHHIHLATQALIEGLSDMGLPAKPWLYPYFSMGYMGPWSAFFLRLPALLNWATTLRACWWWLRPGNEGLHAHAHSPLPGRLNF